MSIADSLILANLILKNKIIDNLAQEHNIDEKFIDKYYDLFLEYANIQIELLKYNFPIPSKKLKRFHLLNIREAKFFAELHYLLDIETKKIKVSKNN